MRFAIVESRRSSSVFVLFGSSMTDSSEEKPDWAADWQSRTDALIIARAQAIDTYAGLERQLANLFSALLDIDQDPGTLAKCQ